MTKERLRNYRKIKQEKADLQQKMEEVETLLYSVKIPHLSDMPRGSSVESNPQEARVLAHSDELRELKEFYRAKIKELAAEQLAIEKAIETLEPTTRLLFRYRYIDDLKWEDVCLKINYSWRQTHNLHSDGLNQLRAQDE